MKKILSLIFFAVFFLIAVGPIRAAEKLVFDSTNNYLGTCQLTDKSKWELKEDFNVTKFQVWYNWNQGETSFPVKVFLNGEKFAEFEAARGSCDPYQKLWCNADYQINKLFPKGDYSTEIPNARQCLKPGGTGAIRLYTEDNVVKDAPPSLTPIPTPTIPTPAAVINQPVNCSCNQTTIILTALVTSVVSSLLITVLLKKAA